MFNLATVNSTAIVMFKLARKIKKIVQCYIFCQQLRLCVVQREIPIENTNEVIIRCLIDHLGEDANALIKHFKVGAVNHFQAFKSSIFWLMGSQVSVQQINIRLD